MRPPWSVQKALRSVIRYYSSAQFKPPLIREVWQPVVGLEIHAQISSKSKLFSRVSTTYGVPPNTHVGPFESAHPGTLPVLNKRCVEAAIMTALALGATVNKISRFDRKHYFYPDLPAGYQITQLDYPIASNGRLDFMVSDSSTQLLPYQHSADLIQLQLEEDSGKSIHDVDSNSVLVDLNRAGKPLMELVFGPELRNGGEARALVKELALILTRIGTCNCHMEEGSLRVDANVSVHKPGEPLGTRAEVKNLNSLNALMKAVDYEIERQIGILESGGTVTNETRSFDVASQQTATMRDKEVIQDYRFMPEPNLPPLRLHDSSEPDCPYNGSLDIQKYRHILPELPAATRHRLITEYGLRMQQAIELVNNDGLLNYFLTIMSESKRSARIVCNLLQYNLLAVLNNRNLSIEESVLSPSAAGEIVDLLQSGQITNNTSQKVMEAIMDGDRGTPAQIVRDNNWITADDDYIITDKDLMEDVVRKVIHENEKLVRKYQKGKKRLALEKLMGKVIEASERRMDWKQAKVILKRELSSEE